MNKGERHCGMTLGHGLSCQPGYQCDNCKQIEELKTILDNCRAARDFMHEREHIRIEELETQVKELETILETSIPSRVRELEAENRIFRDTESVDDSVWDALLEQVRQKNDTIQRVRELPQQWRDISYKTTEEYTNLHGCADQLDSILENSE